MQAVAGVIPVTAVSAVISSARPTLWPSGIPPPATPSASAARVAAVPRRQAEAGQVSPG